MTADSIYSSRLASDKFHDKTQFNSSMLPTNAKNSITIKIRFQLLSQWGLITGNERWIDFPRWWEAVIFSWQWTSIFRPRKLRKIEIVFRFFNHNWDSNKIQIELNFEIENLWFNLKKVIEGYNKIWLKVGSSR